MATEPKDTEEAVRIVDDDRSAKETRQGEALAKHLGISIEELDRRMHAEDNKRDAQGLPPLSKAQLAERIALDDFGKDEDERKTKDVSDPLPGPAASKKKDLRAGEITPEQEQEGDAKLQREADELRRQQAQAAVSRRYIEQGGRYYNRDAGNRLAFEDAGAKLKTLESDPYTASSMALLAQAKGWSSIKVTGSREFKQAVWMEAQLRGIAVRGYTPTEVDKAALQDRQEKQARNTVEQGRAADKAILAPAQAMLHEAAEAARATKGDSRTAEGKILEHGADNYNHDPNESRSYFVRLATSSGEKTVWGIDLKRALEDSEANVGDDVKLEYQGRQPVRVRAAVRDGSGKITGHKEIDTHRNQWSVENKARIVMDKAAEAVVGAKVKDPKVRSAVLNVIKEKLDGMEQSGQPIPPVRVYDPKAAPTRQQEPSITRDRSAERSR